jgi:hypothetical protein
MGDIHTNISRTSTPPTPTSKICGIDGLAIMHKRVYGLEVVKGERGM